MGPTDPKDVATDLHLDSKSGSSESDIFEPYRKVFLKNTFGLSSKLLGIKEGSYLFDSDENVLDVFDMAIQRDDLAEKLDSLKEEYGSKIKYLLKFFNFNYLHTLNLESVRSIYASLTEIQSALQTGRLSSEGITDDTRSIARSILVGPESNAERLLLSERWSNPEDRRPGEKALDFLVRIWGEEIQKGKLGRNEISEIDPSLSNAIRQFYSRRVRSATKKSDALKDLPKWLQVWFEKKAIRSNAEVTHDLLKYGIRKPEDAFQRNLPTKEAQRLYNACKRRMSTAPR